jgi:hypothetical protein
MRTLKRSGATLQDIENKTRTKDIEILLRERRCSDRFCRPPKSCFHVRLISRLVELPQSLLDLGEFDLGLLDGLLQEIEALVVVGNVFGAVGALVGTEVLDLLAAVLDFGHAESRA